MLLEGFVILLVKKVKMYFSIFSSLSLLFSFGLLLLALVLRVGEGTGRTLGIGFISFQPAELVKISLVLFVSRLLANNQDAENPPSAKKFISILAVSGVVCLGISLSNFSTAALLFLTLCS